MSDSHKFKANLTKTCQNIILPIFEEDREGMQTALGNQLFDRNDPVNFESENKPEDRAPILLFYSVFEIDISIQNLLDAEIYIRRFPYSNTRVTKIRHLRYIIINHLNEVYVLKQRLKAFLQLIEELYANGPRRKAVRKVTQPLFQYISMAFNDIVTVRSSHVHKEQFTDNQLRKLEILDLVTKDDNQPETQLNWSGFFGWRYREIRKQKEKQVQTINESIEKVLDIFFSKLYPVVFDENGNVIRV